MVTENTSRYKNQCLTLLIINPTVCVVLKCSSSTPFASIMSQPHNKMMTLPQHTVVACSGVEWLEGSDNDTVTRKLTICLLSTASAFWSLVCGDSMKIRARDASDASAQVQQQTRTLSRDDEHTFGLVRIHNTSLYSKLKTSWRSRSIE